MGTAQGNSNQIANSTDLNMNDGNRTVWFVGENPTTNMPKLVNAKYNVLGINKHTPGKNDFYSGVLTANYGAGKNELSGTISRAGDSVNFAGTNIRSNGTFDNGKANEHITGRFYGNGAEALAGIVDRTGADKDVAFGGAKKITLSAYAIRECRCFRRLAVRSRNQETPFFNRSRSRHK